MKLNKIILTSAALLVAGSAFAQVHVGGYFDFTSTAAAQVFSQANDSDWDAGEVVAEFGPVQNGIAFLNVDAVAQSVEFHTGTWVGSGIGCWYYSLPMFPDRTTETGSWASTSLYQAYLVTKFANEQIKFYSGNFASNGFNAGYISNGYINDVKIDPLAMRGSSGNTAFTGLEWIPNMSVLNGALVGFRGIVGFPIAPFTSDFTNFNAWKNMYKAVKVMASYKWLAPNLTFNAGFRPNTYAMATSYSGTDFTESLFGEAFLQVELPTTIPGLPLHVWYDFRYRTASEDGDNMADGRDWSAQAYAHSGGFSVLMAQLIPGWELRAGDQFAYYGPHYIATNEMAIFNRFGLSAFHNFNGTPYAFGFSAKFDYGQDANGGLIGRDDVYCTDMVGFNENFMADLTSPGSGAATRYLCAYVNPYVQKNFSNGKATLGVEVQYNRAFSDIGTTQTVSWRVPVGLVFWW